MSEVALTFRDGRPIRALVFTHAPDLEVGYGTITAITPYVETDDVTWFAVYCGDFIWQRINANHVCSVVYKKADSL